MLRSRCATLNIRCAKSEQAQREGLDDEEIDHLAYLAEQKVAIAQAQASEERSQNELQNELVVEI